MRLNHKKLSNDMVEKVKELGSTQQIESEKMGLSLIVFKNIRNNGNITLKTFFTVLGWLDNKNANEYIDYDA